MAVRSRRPEAVQNVKAASAHLKPPLLLETNSAAAAPLLIGDGLVGALSVESNQPNAFSPRALMLLATLADQIATGLQRARFGEVQQGSAEGYLDRDQTELR
jgi:GAF domain-containing protein